MGSSPVVSEEVRSYFSCLASQVEATYAIARAARARGFDPELDVEIPLTDDLASRVERLLEHYEVEGVARRIRELAKHHDREELAILVAKEMALRPAASKEKAVERAVRVGLAILTEGILVAPLEGLATVKIKRNRDGTSYVDLSYAGPIRSAGGTGQALSVLIADVVRRELGIGRYQPAREEVERFKEEIPLYRQVQHLQYTPSEEEISLIVSNCPVSINGEGTEDAEISGFRDLPRIETNRIRGGACLVIADGMCLKAPKILKHVRKLRIDAHPRRRHRGRDADQDGTTGEGGRGDALRHDRRTPRRPRHGRFHRGPRCRGGETPRRPRPGDRGPRRDPDPVRRILGEQPRAHARRLLPGVVWAPPPGGPRRPPRRMGGRIGGAGDGVVPRPPYPPPSATQPILPRPDRRGVESPPGANRHRRTLRGRPPLRPGRGGVSGAARPAGRLVLRASGPPDARTPHRRIARDPRDLGAGRSPPSRAESGGGRSARLREPVGRLPRPGPGPDSDRRADGPARKGGTAEDAARPPFPLPDRA